MKLLLQITFLLSAVLIFSSCENDPISLGKDILPDDDFLNVVEVNSTDGNWGQTTSYYKTDSLNLGRSQRLLLGKIDGNIEASFLIKFFIFIPESVYNPLLVDSINVLKSWIELDPSYKIGNTNSSFNFTVNEVYEYWQFNNFTEDSLNNLSIGSEDMKVSQAEISDTLFSFEVNKDLVQAWMDVRVDTTLSRKNNGLYFHSNSDYAIGFPASNGTIYGFTPRLYIELEKPGSFIDTLLTEIVSDDVHIVKGSVIEPPQNEIILQAGLGQRGALKFDLTNIPKNVVLNKAVLEINIDSSKSLFGNPSTDSLAVYFYSDEELKTIDNQVRVRYLVRNGYKYSGQVETVVQNWINGKENNGIELRLSDEVRGLTRSVIYGSDFSDSSLKPKLTLVYAELK